MLKQEDIINNPRVKNIKYRTVEQVIGTCKMKDSQRGWCVGVLYKGPDRNNDNIPVIFCKNIHDFCKEFELAPEVENKESKIKTDLAEEFWASVQG